MIVLTIRTDKPEAEVGLFENQTQLAYEVWHAHRELSATIHIKIRQLLEAEGKNWDDLEGIVCFKGPGSFTGLRIGVTVGNTLAYALNIPIAAESGAWIEQGIARLVAGENDKIALPLYGALPNTTQPKK